MIKRLLLALTAICLSTPVLAQSPQTYTTIASVAALKALTGRPAVIEVTGSNPGIFNWSTTPCSAADDIFQVTPTSGPTGCYTRMTTPYAVGKASPVSSVLISGGTGTPAFSTTLPSAVQTNITALGTIATGTWEATDVGVAHGGTGASTAVSASVNLSTEYVVGGIADLKALSFPGPSAVNTRYYATAGDQGGGSWVPLTGNQSSKVTSDPRGCVWAAPASDPTGASGVWERQYTGFVNVFWCGAVADGTSVAGTDNCDAFQSAFSIGRSVFVPPGRFRIDCGELNIAAIHDGFTLQGSGHGGTSSTPGGTEIIVGAISTDFITIGSEPTTTATFTGTVVGTDLTVTGISGTIDVNDIVECTGDVVRAKIESQSSGTPGGDGVYVLSATITAAGVACTTSTETAISGPTIRNLRIDASQQVSGRVFYGRGVTDGLIENVRVVEPYEVGFFRNFDFVVFNNIHATQARGAFNWHFFGEQVSQSHIVIMRDIQNSSSAAGHGIVVEGSIAAGFLYDVFNFETGDCFQAKAGPDGTDASGFYAFRLGTDSASGTCFNILAGSQMHLISPSFSASAGNPTRGVNAASGTGRLQITGGSIVAMLEEAIVFDGTVLNVSGTVIARNGRTENSIDSASWAAGTVTATTATAHGIAVGDTFVVEDSNPSGYDGVVVATSGTTGTTLKYAVTADPGSYTSGAKVLKFNAIEIGANANSVVLTGLSNGRESSQTGQQVWGLHVSSSFTGELAISGGDWTGSLAGPINDPTLASGNYTVDNRAVLLGVTIRGYTTTTTLGGVSGAVNQMHGTGNASSAVSFGFNWVNDAFGMRTYCAKSRGGAVVGTHGAVNSGDDCASFNAYYSSGTTFGEGSRIIHESDGGSGSGSTPGRIVFMTTPSASTTAVEAMRIAADGRVTLAGALNYGGVTFAATTTGSGSLVGSISPTFTGTVGAAAITATGVVRSNSGFNINGTAGASCSVGTLNPATAVVTNGLITTC